MRSSQFPALLLIALLTLGAGPCCRSGLPSAPCCSSHSSPRVCSQDLRLVQEESGRDRNEI